MFCRSALSASTVSVTLSTVFTFSVSVPRSTLLALGLCGWSVKVSPSVSLSDPLQRHCDLLVKARPILGNTPSLRYVR
ncbi:hypothetical protein EYF80_054587 [Liparis tanakae]|uniref:Uncharacterized protein n=1 Tax=Liparis tanakae TaxID=230148 RepID=A0A4Z2F286_9TELE|nr:hypothetical protein EYF80_054587 [Liparis tanakae]